ncbi:PQQ-binding-like beta-propeller repeat protein [Sphingobium nicotianae]|uniref:PQQ-binding-like beta-propeller repeat protein n=1 Tax=Sphingobium nicotianae TaxID=2782607 RepID=A0A9X1IS50_9SPHN|nr:PQQ-binding-like beta-propeller repeat protein [Sphingobium nicotianae]MBT2187815.1 PQQ-binding-like beta-propeller repeat protein [Sphingobium nicotianae]
MKRAIALLLGAGLLAPSASAQTIDAADWPRYTRDMGGTRFSPLTQINTGNVGSLASAWSFQVRPEGGGAIVSSATPIAIGGTLYLPIGNAIVALDGSTGKPLWRHPVTNGLARRAVSYWPGDKGHAPRIFYSNGPSLFALDARTGEAIASFGKNGAVAMGVPYNGPPTIYQNVLIVGANTQEMQVGPPGNTRAFDAITGSKIWEFHTVAQPGEVGHETWLDDGWKGRSGTNVWIWYMTLDERTGTLYMPVGGPSANYYGGDRKGANLFGNSLVAVDALTGKYKWHFQTIHHDLWDSDLPAPPVLVDLKVKGRTVHALAETGKPGFMYILDRTTGKPVHGVEEKPVAAGDLPGEWYSPTQPIPAMEDLVRHSWTSNDIVTAADTNETHAAACRALLASYGGFFNSGPFTPFFLHQEGGPVKASINLPNNGGSNWGGSAADPKSGLVFINVSEGGSIGFVEKRKDGADYGRGTEGSNQLYDRGSLAGPGAYSTFSAPYKDPATGRTTTMPCIRPPWGRLIAVDANSGKIAWASRLGVTEALGKDKELTGRNNTFGGPIVTAGGLVFIGATDDRRFRAFDATTGKELWSQTLDYAPLSVPITYRGRDGRQYIAVVAATPTDQSPRTADGKPANGEALITFALPR